MKPQIVPIRGTCSMEFSLLCPRPSFCPRLISYTNLPTGVSYPLLPSTKLFTKMWPEWSSTNNSDPAIPLLRNLQWLSNKPSVLKLLPYFVHWSLPLPSTDWCLSVLQPPCLRCALTLGYLLPPGLCKGLSCFLEYSLHPPPLRLPPTHPSYFSSKVM